MSRVLVSVVCTGILAWMVGCGGASQAPKSADDVETEDQSLVPDTDADVQDSPRDEAAETTEGPDETKGSDQSSEQVEPQFTEGMSVNDAINAVPQGLPRENLEDDVLTKPLLDMSVYAPCKLTAAQHFSIRFAVWEGKVVGADITTSPNNANLEKCLREVVSRVKWTDKVRSLNVSTVSF